MEPIFLRHRSGTPLGPFTHWTLEILWDAHVIDESTPVSSDGVTFAPVGHRNDLLKHLQGIKEQLDNGDDPWPDSIQVMAPDGHNVKPQSSAQALAPDASTISLLIAHALDRSNGRLELQTQAGVIGLQFREGKIVVVDVDDDALSFPAWLIEQNIAASSQIDAAKQLATNMNGDIGGALVSSGTLAPNLYFEKLIAWATVTLGRCALRTFSHVRFKAETIDPPTVPLGFDRFGILFQAVREASDRASLEVKFTDKRDLPLIPSQVEGLTFEDAKPKPRELRVFNAINGVLSLDDLLERFGGDDERNRDILRAVFFATEAGFIIFGVDPKLEAEEAEAAKLTEELRRLANKNRFELFNISATASDREVRQKYTDLAKKYHPDTLRPRCAEALRTAKQNLFSLISEAFETIDTTEKRRQYRADLESGKATSRTASAKVESTISAETTFKKAEVLMRLKKYDEALQYVDQALGLMPDETEFTIFRVYLRYLDGLKHQSSDGDAQTTARRIAKLMNERGDVARGHLYLGYLYKSLDEVDASIRAFRKVLSFDSGNPEATREIAMAKARRERAESKADRKKRWPF